MFLILNKGSCDCSRAGVPALDGVVDVLDVSRVLDVFGNCRTGACIDSDLNCDGVVNQTDIVVVLSSF